MYFLTVNKQVCLYHFIYIYIYTQIDYFGDFFSPINMIVVYNV